MRRGRAQPCLNGVLNLREDSMTKVIQSFQGSTFNPLTQGLRGEVDPWETLPFNNPPFHWAGETHLCQNSVSHMSIYEYSQSRLEEQL